MSDTAASPEREAFEKWFAKASFSNWIIERCFDAWQAALAWQQSRAQQGDKRPGYFAVVRTLQSLAFDCCSKNCNKESHSEYCRELTAFLNSCIFEGNPQATGGAPAQVEGGETGNGSRRSEG